MSRYLAVDPGEKRIGISLSDPSGTIARPFQIIKHVSRFVDAATVAEMATNQEVQQIIIGMALDTDGFVGPQARKSVKLAEAIRTQTSIPVVLWDESNTTQAAKQAMMISGTSVKKRKDPIDAIAAMMILQSYLDHLADQKGILDDGDAKR